MKVHGSSYVAHSTSLSQPTPSPKPLFANQRPEAQARHTQRTALNAAQDKEESDDSDSSEGYASSTKTDASSYDIPFSLMSWSLFFAIFAFLSTFFAFLLRFFYLRFFLCSFAYFSSPAAPSYPRRGAPPAPP